MKPLHLCCIDPGIVNFGIRFETREVDEDDSINITNVLNETIMLDKKKRLVTSLLACINRYKDRMKKCDYILIEAQPNKCIKLCKVEFGLECLCTTLFKKSKVFVVNNKDKYIYNLIVTQHSTKSERKNKLGPEKAIEICDKYNDNESINEMGLRSKLDELADTILMIEAFLIKNKIEGYYKPLHINKDNVIIINEMTVTQLKELAKDNHIKHKSNIKKKDLIDLLTTHYLEDY